MISLKEINDFTATYKDTVPEMPLGGLTSELQDIIRQFAGEQHAPSNYVALALLTAFGSLIGKRTKVYDGAWENYMNFYACLVGYSTDGKSPSCRPVLKPIQDISVRNHEMYIKELEEYNLLDDDAKRRAQRPIEKKLIIDNVTTEKLLSDLYKTQKMMYGGMLAYPDELDTLFGNLDRYSSGSSIGYYLRAWDGSSIRVDRKYDDYGELIQDPFLSILGGVQPGILRKIFSGYYGNGFFPRWTFVLPNRKAERIDKNEIHHKYWNEIVEIILENSLEGSLPSKIVFSEDAKTLLSSNDGFREEISERLKITNTELSELIMKQNYIVRRLAGVIHVLNSYSKRIPPTGTISLQEYLYAEELDEFFVKCAALTQKMMNAAHTQKMGTKELLIRLNEIHPITNISALSEALGGKPTKQYISKCLLNSDTTEIERREKDANDAYPIILTYMSTNCKSLVRLAGIPTLDEFRDCMMQHGDYIIKETLRKLDSFAESNNISSDGVYTTLFDLVAKS